MVNGYVVCEPINVTVVSGNFITDLSIKRFNELIQINKPIIFSKIVVPPLRGDVNNAAGTVVTQNGKIGITLRIGVNNGQFEISGDKVILVMLV